MGNRNKEEGLMLACVVPKPNVEVLTRAMHGLAKIGDELFVEPVESGLVFRTVHANYSVYAEALFKENFFAYYKNSVPPDNPSNSEVDENKLNCRITMKSCLIAFKSLAWIKRQVETCLLTVEPTCLTVKFRCNHGLVRTQKLPVIECESLQAFYTEDEVPNILSVGPKTFASVIKNFQSSERDITLAVDHEKAVLQNFSVGGTDPKAIVRSQLKMEKCEFESFRVDEETAVTFSLKAFRAALTFSDQAEYPLTIKFSSPGSPVIVNNTSPTYELRFVLSSLAPDECDMSKNHSQQMLTPLRTVGPNKRTATAARRSSSEVDRQSTSSFNCDTETASRQVSNRPANPGPSSSKPKGPSRSLRLPPSTESQRSDSQRHFSQSSVASTTGACVGTDQHINRLAEKPVEKPAPSGLRWQLDENPLVIPESDGEDSDKFDEDAIPGTPPLPQPKKSRQFFQRCFEPTIHCINLPDDTVLAEDSD